MSSRSSLEALRISPRVAELQAGAFTRTQARAEGWTDHQIRHRLCNRIWVPLYGRSLVAPSAQLSPLTIAWGAQLAVATAVISHFSAGAIYGFPLPGALDRTGRGAVGTPQESVVHVMTHRHRLPDGMIGHRSPPLAPADIVRWSGLTITTKRRTALDCLALLARDEAVDLWAWLAARGVLDAGTLAEAARQRFGQRGTPTLLHVLTLGRGGAGSLAERRLHQLLRHAGLTGWRAGQQVRDRSGRIIAVPDVLFAGNRLVIEVDGYRAHSSPEAFVRDRRRQNSLVNAGFRVLRVTWADLRERPGEVIDEIRAALA